MKDDLWRPIGPQAAPTKYGSLARSAAIVMLALSACAFYAPFEKPLATSAAMTPNRLFEAGLLGVSATIALLLLLFIRGVKVRLTPATILAFTFAILACASALWSTRGTYTVFKAGELVLILFVSHVFLSVSSGPFGNREAVKRDLASALLIVVGYTLVTNVFIAGTPFKFTDLGYMRNARLVGVFSHPTEYSDLVSVALIALICSGWKGIRVLGMGAALVIMLVMTDTRSAIIGLLVALVVSTLVGKKLTMSRFSLLVPAAAILLVGAAWYISTQGNPEELGTLNGRLFIWAHALSVFLSHPILGVGYANSADFLIMPTLLAAGSAHSSYVEIAVTTGLVGGLLLFAFLGYGVFATYRTRDRLAIMILSYVLVRAFFDHLVFAAEVPTLVLFVVIGSLAYEALRLPDAVPMTRVRFDSANSLRWKATR